MSSQRSPKFSFLIANYNNRLYFDDLLDSLCAQTVSDWEAVIVDDGSTDGGIADIVAARNDSRLQYIQLSENHGLAYARNMAIRHSKGRFLANIDADDIVQPTYLAEVSDAFRNNDIDICYVDLKLFGAYEAAWFFPEKTIKELTTVQWIPIVGACLTREATTKSGGYYEGPELRYGNEDWDFWLNVAEKTSFRVCHIPKLLYLYRQHTTNLSKKLSFYRHITHECIYLRHKALFDEHDAGAAFLAAGYYECFATHWANGTHGKAIELAVSGAKHQPFAKAKRWSVTGDIAQLARTCVALEKKFESMHSEAYAPTQENIEARIQLVAMQNALEQWENVEENLCALFSICFGNKLYELASQCATQLALLFSDAGREQDGVEATSLALLCDPFNMDAVALCFQNAVAQKRYNEALQLFLPWLSIKEKQKLMQAAPWFAVLGTIPNRDVAWVEQRLQLFVAHKREREKNRGDWDKSLYEKVYASPLGRRMIWEFRAKDLYETYGATQGGHKALLKAIEYTKPMTLLEVGCGDGRNLALFSRLGLECFGQEISATALTLAKQRNLPNVTLLCKPLAEIDFQGKIFDLVVCNRVLQHLTEEELPCILDTINQLGRFVYINESVPGDETAESWYLKKYDFVSLMQAHGFTLQCKISEDDVKNAMIFKQGH